jgi:hypothetical protein
MAKTVEVRLVDLPEDAGRTTATLFSSLAARLIALHYTSGVSIVGSTLAGLAEIGREVSKTAEGARLRRALETSEVAKNGDAIWKALRIADWTNGMPASPILDHVRNDLALILAEDLSDVVDDIPVPQETRLTRSPRAPEDLNFMDTLLGLWLYSREIVSAIEALAGKDSASEATFDAGDGLGNGAILK